MGNIKWLKNGSKRIIIPKKDLCKSHKSLIINGAGCQSRTDDLMITNKQSISIYTECNCVFPHISLKYGLTATH